MDDQNQSPPRVRGLQSSVSTPFPTRSRAKNKTLTEYPNTAGVATQLRSNRPCQSIKFTDKREITLIQPNWTTRLSDSKDGNVSRGRSAGSSRAKESAKSGRADEDAGSKERDSVDSKEKDSVGSERIREPDGEDGSSEDDEN